MRFRQFPKKKKFRDLNFFGNTLKFLFFTQGPTPKIGVEMAKKLFLHEICFGCVLYNFPSENFYTLFTKKQKLTSFFSKKIVSQKRKKNGFFSYLPY